MQTAQTHSPTAPTRGSTLETISFIGAHGMHRTQKKRGTAQFTMAAIGDDGTTALTNT